MLVAVGGDYLDVNQRRGTCSTSSDGGRRWRKCKQPPGGYRSAVAFDGAAQAWIAVGPTGTDISFDDGQHWKPLTANGDADADRDWNALSLPFVVGSHGRIARLQVFQRGRK